MKKFILKVLTILLAIFLFVGFSWASNVTLNWDANTEPDLAGYYIYQALRMGDYTDAWQRITPDLITDTTYIVTGLDNANYAWLCTAVDNSG